MKATVNETTEKGYILKTITITFESLEEERGFRHLYGCGFADNNCFRPDDVEMVKRQLEKIFAGKLII